MYIDGLVFLVESYRIQRLTKSITANINAVQTQIIVSVTLITKRNFTSFIRQLGGDVLVLLFCLLFYWDVD